MEKTSRVSMAALSNPLDISHEEARLRHADRATPRTAFHVMQSDTVHDHFVERDGLRFAGTHLLIDLWQASNLDDIEVVETALRNAVAAAGATLSQDRPSQLHAERRDHTWPERAYAAVDVFMCGDADPHKAIEVLRHAFGPRMLTVSEHRRGVMP
jgi:S-adenosylmethionine decarboxylase